MFVSIILPTYNRAKSGFLQDAIKSVQKQTHKDWELIIIDDGSTDFTKDVVAKFQAKDDRIRYKKIEQSGGYLGVPRNEGHKLARYDFIAFIDSDVEWRKDHLQALCMAFERAEGLDVAYGQRLVVDARKTLKNRLFKPRFVAYQDHYNLAKISHANYIDTSDVLIRKSTLEAVGGWDEKLKKFADWNLFVRLGKYGAKFFWIPVILTEYKVHDSMNQEKHKDTEMCRSGEHAPHPLPTYFDPLICTWEVPTRLNNYKVKEPKVAIFTITWNRKELTEKMHESMVRTAGYPFDWYVVDNGSTDGTGALIRSLNPTWLMQNEDNLGISKASNQALDAIGKEADIIMKVDNDALFMTDGWLKVIAGLWQVNRAFVLSPRVEGLMQHPGGMPRADYLPIGEYLLGRVGHLGGISIAAPSEAYMGFRWKEDDFLHSEQDVIFSQMLNKKGYKLYYLEDFVVEHMGKVAEQTKEYNDKWKEARTKRLNIQS